MWSVGQPAPTGIEDHPAPLHRHRAPLDRHPPRCVDVKIEQSPDVESIVYSRQLPQVSVMSSSPPGRAPCSSERQHQPLRSAALALALAPAAATSILPTGKLRPSVDVW